MLNKLHLWFRKKKKKKKRAATSKQCFQRVIYWFCCWSRFQCTKYNRNQYLLSFQSVSLRASFGCSKVGYSILGMSLADAVLDKGIQCKLAEERGEVLHHCSLRAPQDPLIKPSRTEEGVKTPNTDTVSQSKFRLHKNISLLSQINLLIFSFSF